MGQTDTFWLFGIESRIEAVGSRGQDSGPRLATGQEQASTVTPPPLRHTNPSFGLPQCLVLDRILDDTICHPYQDAKVTVNLGHVRPKLV